MAYDPEQAKKEAEDAKKGGSGKFSEVEYFEMVEGENRFRILPCIGERKVPWVKGLVSHKNGASGKRMIRPKFDDFCPLKKHLDALYAKGDTISKERADLSWPKTRIWMWIVPRAPHPQAGKRVLYECDQKTWPDIAGIFADPEYGYIAEPHTGRDLKIIYTPSSKTGTPFPSREVRTAASQTVLGTEEEIVTWCAKDWFSEYGVGEPMDPEYIQAVIDEKEEEWKEKRKAEADAKKAAGGSTGGGFDTAPPPPSPATSLATGPTKKVVLGSGPNEQWHFYNKTLGQQTTSPAIHAEDLFLSGHDFMMCRFDGVGGWQDPAALGFKVEEYVPPPAPVAPPPPAPVAPTPPVVAAPPPAPTPLPAPVAPTAPTPPVERKFWVSNNGVVEQKTESEVVDFMKAGWDGPIMQDGQSAWSTTQAYGFKRQVPAAAPPVSKPAAPPPPSAAPPMPPPSNDDAQSALQRQIDALKAASAGQGGPNSVIDSLK